MGTTYSVKFAGDRATIDAAGMQQEIDALLEQINDQMSTYRPESEINRFSRSAAGEWFPVSGATAAVVAESLEVSEKSGGALDVTVGPLVRLWDFGPRDENSKRDASGVFTPPTVTEIATALESVGYRRLAVRSDPPALRKEVDGLEIDLSAVAKGYGVDAVALLLEGRGIKNYMVEIGGEVRCGGQRPDGRPWQIGIERPDANRREVQLAIPLADSAVATSGDYRNFHEQSGHRFQHIIDPATGRPAENALASASVLAETCLAADAWATALVVLGPQRAYDSAEEHGIAAMLIARSTEGLVMRPTPAWAARFPNLASSSNEIPPGGTMVYIIAAVLIALAVLGMAVGVIVRNHQLRGSCGGLANLRDEHGHLLCEACDHPSRECSGDPAAR